MVKKCWNCGMKITKNNYKKHYPIISGLFCKETVHKSKRKTWKTSK